MLYQRGSFVTNLTEPEPNPSWEADSHSASQEIPLFLWNLQDH